MNPIEQAAREIRDFVQSTWGDTRADDQTEFAEIIRRHLFPEVKPEDVKPLTWYWCLNRGKPNKICQSDGDGGFYLDKYDEIRGPIQSPEDTQ